MLRKVSAMFLSVAVVFSLAFVMNYNTAQSEEGIDAKEVYTDQRCNNCHAIESEGIEAKMGDKYPDLSKLTGDYDAETLKKYLNKETKINKKNHLMKFGGSDEELDAIVAWLLELHEANSEETE